MKTLRIGVLAFQGDVREHEAALQKAALAAKTPVSVSKVRSKQDLEGLHGLVIPGGESTVLQKLCERADMLSAMKKIPALFGTCAGAILISDAITDKAPGQVSLRRIGISVKRNAYGRQNESFESEIETRFGKMHAIFIRAPRILRVLRKGVTVLGEADGEVVACEEASHAGYALAACFHPELTTTKFHEHFLRRVAERA
jgi:5'-phosphate synthase pdxT subunit